MSDRHTNVKGRVVNVSRHYGFVKVGGVLDNVYFVQQSFEDNRHADLFVSGLRTDDRVVLDIVKKPESSQYRGLNVRREGYVRPALVEELPSHFVDEEGVVTVVKDSHGFVRLSKFHKVTASFQKKDLEAYMGKSIATLRDVLTVNAKLRFSAISNPDERAKCRWLIENVHLVDGIPRGTKQAVARPSKPKAGGAGSVKLVNHHGHVLDVFLDHATLKCGAQESGIAFLHASVVEKCLEVDIEDLREVLEVGSRVRFDADVNEQRDGRGNWCVTRVDFCEPKSRTASVSTHSSSGYKLDVENGAGTTSDVTESAGIDSWDRETEGQQLGADDENRNGDSAAVQENGWADDWSNRYVMNEEEFPPLAPSTAPEEAPVGPLFEPLFEAPVEPLAEPLISIHQDAPAVVANVTGNSIECYVKEPGRTRTVQFSVGSFYRNGLLNVSDRLGQGDEVKLDYMVGVTPSGGEIVHCDLAWQGKKPRNVPRMSAEDMLARIDVGSPPSVAEDDTFGADEDGFLREMIHDDGELDALLDDSFDTAPEEDTALEEDARPALQVPARPSPTQGSRSSSPGCSSAGAGATAPGNVRGDAFTETLQHMLTENLVPAFAKMIIEQLAAVPGNHRVHLRHASTQTEF